MTLHPLGPAWDETPHHSGTNTMWRDPRLWAQVIFVIAAVVQIADAF